MRDLDLPKDLFPVLINLEPLKKGQRALHDVFHVERPMRSQAILRQRPNQINPRPRSFRSDVMGMCYKRNIPMGTVLTFKDLEQCSFSGAYLAKRSVSRNQILFKDDLHIIPNSSYTIDSWLFIYKEPEKEFKSASLEEENYCYSENLRHGVHLELGKNVKPCQVGIVVMRDVKEGDKVKLTQLVEVPVGRKKHPPNNIRYYYKWMLENHLFARDLPKGTLLEKTDTCYPYMGECTPSP